MYRNEGGAGAAVKKSGIPREDLFFTTKVYTRDMGYEKTKRGIKSSLKESGLDYIDLYEPIEGILVETRDIEDHLIIVTVTLSMLHMVAVTLALGHGEL